MFTFHQPLEEPVQAAVLGIDVALGELLGFGVGPLPEPPHPVLEVGEVFLEMLGGDLLHVRPALLLGVQGGHGDSRFEAGEVSGGVLINDN